MFDIGLVVNRQLHIIRAKATPSTISKRRNSVLILAGKSYNMAVRVAKHLVLAGFSFLSGTETTSVTVTDFRLRLQDRQVIRNTTGTVLLFMVY